MFSDDHKTNLLNNYFLKRRFIDSSNKPEPYFGPPTTLTIRDDLFLNGDVNASETRYTWILLNRQSIGTRWRQQ